MRSILWVNHTIKFARFKCGCNPLRFFSIWCRITMKIIDSMNGSHNIKLKQIRHTNVQAHSRTTRIPKAIFRMNHMDNMVAAVKCPDISPWCSCNSFKSNNNNKNGNNDWFNVGCVSINSQQIRLEKMTHNNRINYAQITKNKEYIESLQNSECLPKNATLNKSVLNMLLLNH